MMGLRRANFFMEALILRERAGAIPGSGIPPLFRKLPGSDSSEGQNPMMIRLQNHMEKIQPEYWSDPIWTGFQNKHIPNFSWGMDGEKTDFDKFIQTLKIVKEKMKTLKTIKL